MVSHAGIFARKGQNHLFSLGNNWYFGGVAEATSRKVQTDYLFKAISEAPNAIFRCAPFRMSGFLVFSTPQNGCHFVYIYVSWKVENRRRGKGARRKSAFGLCFIALKSVSFCTFRGVAPAGPQNVNYSLGKSNGFARGNLFAEGQNHCFFLRNNWYF